MKKTLVATLATLLVVNCSGGRTVEEEDLELPALGDVPNSAWEALSKRTIYFGHQSVGFNIMAGVKDVLEQNPQIGLQVVESADPKDLDEGVFCHSKIGDNNKPITKMDGLRRFMGLGHGDAIDIAFVKFCFVDVMADTDVAGLFQRYRETLSSLKETYPYTTFVHLTIPLRIRMKPSLKYIVRNKLTGWVAFADNKHNLARNKYNDLLREAYNGSNEPIFDVAAVESTHLDGRREVSDIDGNKCYSLVHGFTHDGGHLNVVGRKRVAEQLLIFLSSLS